MSQSLKNKLQQISNEPNSSIRKSVAIEALEYHCPKSFFNDLYEHGCQSGMITSLIYYSDIHKFFDEHYEEIDSIRYEYEQEVGIQLNIQGDLKNFLAWFAFESIAMELANEMEVEL